MSRTLRIASLAAVFAMSAFMAGCAGPAPNYSPSIANVEAIKTSGAAASKVVPIAVAAEMPGGKSMGMRANSMTSPVGAHFGDYISAALRQELELAKLHNPQAGTEISGSLLRNNIDAGGISTNEGQIEVRFVVKRGDQERFNKVKRIEHKWESSFAAAVAIPLAANNYPVMVQKLIATLVSDPDFIQALRN